MGAPASMLMAVGTCQGSMWCPFSVMFPLFFSGADFVFFSSKDIRLDVGSNFHIVRLYVGQTGESFKILDPYTVSAVQKIFRCCFPGTKL